MNKIVWLAGVLIFGLFACRSVNEPPGADIDFGIYEIIDPAQLPPSIVQRLQEIQVRPSDPAQGPVAGQSSQQGPEWREALSAIGTDEGIRMAETSAPAHAETNSPANEGEEIHEVVALKNPAVITASDIREAIGEPDRVVIHMNRQGAKKWAGMTERNQGKFVAFLLEGQVCNMPLVAATIRTGEALITGLDAAEAKRIAALINGDEER